VGQIEFFKATSRGGLDSIENSADSLHNRRSIIIRDDYSSTLWIIHGSGTAKKTKLSAEKNVERINTENDARYKVVKIDYDDAEEKIEEILSQNSPTQGTTSKAISLHSIPKVPSGPKSEEEDTTPLGDRDHNGPEIEEFQIAYYVEEGNESSLMQQTLELVAQYIKEIDSIIAEHPSKKSATRKLRELSDDIISLIYQKD